jgi:hypothetical protein
VGRRLRDVGEASSLCFSQGQSEDASPTPPCRRRMSDPGLGNRILGYSRKVCCFLFAGWICHIRTGSYCYALWVDLWGLPLNQLRNRSGYLLPTTIQSFVRAWGDPWTGERSGGDRSGPRCRGSGAVLPTVNINKKQRTLRLLDVSVLPPAPRPCDILKDPPSRPSKNMHRASHGPGRSQATSAS